MEDFLAHVSPAVLILIAAILPPLQAIINAYRWSAPTKALVALGVAAVVGVAAGLLDGVATREGLVTYAAGVYGLSQVAYHGVWKPTGAADAIEENVLSRRPDFSGRL